MSDMDLTDTEASQEAVSTEINTYLMCICDSVKDKSSNNQLIGIVVSRINPVGIYCKNPKNLDTQKIAVITLKLEQIC